MQNIFDKMRESFAYNCGFDLESETKDIRSKVLRYLNDGIYSAARDPYRILNQLELSRGQRCDEKWDDWSGSTSREWGSWDGGT